MAVDSRDKPADGNPGPGSPPDDALARLSVRVVELFDRLSAWEQSVVEGTGLPLPHMHVVEVLGGSGGPWRMRDLAERLGVTTGTLTVTVDKLEKAGLAERLPNPEDRRSWFIGLTPRGLQLQQDHSGYHLSLVREACADFLPGEIDCLEDLLARFTKNM